MQRNFSTPGRSPVHSTNCAVATSHPLGVSTALDILRSGGNAVDAAIAACATLCVVEPHMTGIGGDCFALIAEPDGTLHGLNGSGKTPANASIETLIEKGFTKIPVESPFSVTVPGALRAWESLHQRFGRMDFARLLSDAVRFAEDGFPVAPRVGLDWAQNLERLSADEGARAHYLFDGQVPYIGQRITAPALATTLRKIATEGVSAFYEGEIAAEIVDTISKLGGVMTEEDLAANRAEWVEPVSAAYGDYHLHEIPPNGQGLAALVLARLYDVLDKPTDPGSAERAHLEIECGRIAYALRDAHISDPETMNLTAEELLSDDYVQRLASLFDPKRRNENISLPHPHGSDTIYVTVVDEDGLKISFINSLFANFGSCIVTPRSGISLHNRACGFNLIPRHPNAFGPSKRPLHTIIPAMLSHKGVVTHSFGVMGGQYQAMGHGHVVSRMLDYGMDPQMALDQPRIFWDDLGNIVLEAGVSPEVEAALVAKGHQCKRGPMLGGGQIIHIDPESGVLTAGSDHRKDGHAAGF